MCSHVLFNHHNSLFGRKGQPIKYPTIIKSYKTGQNCASSDQSFLRVHLVRTKVIFCKASQAASTDRPKSQRSLGQAFTVHWNGKYILV